MEAGDQGGQVGLGAPETHDDVVRCLFDQPGEGGLDPIGRHDLMAGRPQGTGDRPDVRRVRGSHERAQAGGRWPGTGLGHDSDGSGPRIDHRERLGRGFVAGR